MDEYHPDAPSRSRRAAVARTAGRTAILTAMVGGSFAFGAVATPPAPEGVPVAIERAPAASRSHERSDLPATLTVVVNDSAAQGPVTVPAAHGTVRDVLRALGTVLAPHDVVVPALDTPVTADLSIVVSRAVPESQTATVNTPYTTRTVEDPAAPAGTRTVTRAGQDGTVVTVYTVMRTPEGEEIAREAVLTFTTAPVEEVVSIGTLPAPRPAPVAAVEAPAVGALVAPGTNRALGQSLAASHGWSGEQFACLDSLWQKESEWDHTARNRSSGAFGIPQSLPASKMASAGADWQTNPATQIRWGLGYIGERYGTPCAAWAHSRAKNWY
jgi:resuscitation-promoting factor RpfB